jgi:hypothetical protein
VTFAWSATKDGRVRISWRGNVVTTLAGEPAARFLEQVEDADEDAEQLLLAPRDRQFQARKRAPGSLVSGPRSPSRGG